jgi:aryl-alcohol dehydrogenase-like predicted oxidoreductase
MQRFGVTSRSVSEEKNMRFHQLGDSELRVSEICLGTMTWGQQNTQKEAHDQLSYALAQGINFVDAAEMYPVPTRAETQGATESILGEWLATQPRDKVIVATKIAASGRPIQWVRNGSLAVNRSNVQTAVDSSLRRLKTDYIDLYQIHWPDRYVPVFGATAYEPSQERSSTPIVEQLQALAEVIKQGKVRYFGLSNETAWGVARFSFLAEQHSLPKPVSIQNAYSLINRTFDSALAEAAHRERVDLLAYSALAFGFLTGKHLNGPAPDSRVSLFDGFAARYRKPNVDEAVAAYVKLAQSCGLTATQLALAFAKSRWFVKSTIIGATTRAQLQENIQSFDITLAPEILTQVDAIHARFPNPAP